MSRPRPRTIFGSVALQLALMLTVARPAAPSTSTQSSILDIAIDVARRDHVDLSESRVRAQIEELARKYRELAPDGSPAAERADAFRRLLFDVGGFRAVPDLESSRTLHIDSVLRDRRGYCLSLSIVALAVAEHVGEPLHGVAAPNHFFVRYDDGVYRRNLELTRRGAEVTDAQFRERAPGIDAASVYLRALDNDEIRASLLHNRGFVAMSAGRLAQARADLDEAIRALPGLPEAHRNLGVLLGEQGDWKKAKSSFIRALACYADDIDAMINLAVCRHALGEADEAIQEIEMVLDLDDDHPRAGELLRAWQAERRRDAGEARPQAVLEPPAGIVPGLDGKYFADSRLQRLALRRIDRRIDFDWNRSSPGHGVPRDRFSVRWDGYLAAPRAGNYRFYVAANDGCRVTIDGRVVVENWRAMGTENWYGTGDRILDPGYHAIRVEHFDAGGGARILLRVGIEGEEQPLDLARQFFHRPPQPAGSGTSDR